MTKNKTNSPSPELRRIKEKSTRPTDNFGPSLAKLLAGKISKVNTKFNAAGFIDHTTVNCGDKKLTQRIELMADGLKMYLPEGYPKALSVLNKIMGPENPNEIGMFTYYYWLMPIGKFIEKYGLDHFEDSIVAIEELTKRNTGEYAIRPYIRKYPKETLKQMTKWARSDNFHLRRLSSEGLRPKLPWALKLDLFIEKPKPVFEILDILKTDHIKFVKKSVANHLTDYLKVNPKEAYLLINKWKKSDNEHTQWIIKHATRKEKVIEKKK